jgi:alpha-tubulin suppressor-like RCC1 family protein
MADFTARDFRPVSGSEIDLMQAGAYLSTQTATAPSDPANYDPSTYYWNAGIKRDASSPWARSTYTLPCIGGEYHDGTSCVESSAGHYVDGWGQASQVACGWGKYQPNTGQTTCIDSPAGHYVAADVTSVQAGGDHVCALKTATRSGEAGSMVHCWGSNQYGQIGDGSYTDYPSTDNDAMRPKWLGTSVFANGSVSQIDTGTASTCALLSDGSIRCWGSNANGMLGDGTTTNRLSPTATASLGQGRTATSISVGHSHTCAILDDGSVKCWGSNDYGQLGDGTTVNRVAPTSTASLGAGRTATSIAVGTSFSCAILDDGSVKCWGSNDYGEIGNGGSSSQYESPQGTLSLGVGRTADSISAGGNHVCVILDDGSVKCWGRGNQGQLGRGSTDDGSGPTDSPVDLGTGRTATAISAGSHTTCAVLDDGSVKCWGSNDYGQLGDGTTTDRLSPVATSSLGTGRTAISVTAGGVSTCAILDDGSVKCWGRNNYGQVGNGQEIDTDTPVGVLFVGSDAGIEVRTCPVGHFNSGTQRSWCYQAQAGHYVDTEGATSQISCASGTNSIAGSDESGDCS